MTKLPFISSAFFIWLCAYSLPVMAGSASSSIAVKTKITLANCTINGGKGISGVYNLPVMDEHGKVETRFSYVDAPVIIDCTKGATLGALGVSFTPGSSGFYDAGNGVMSTTYPDVGLQVRWKRNGGGPVDLSGTIDILAMKDAQTSVGIYDSSLRVSPLKLATGTTLLTPGRYQADLTVNITYY